MNFKQEEGFGLAEVLVAIVGIFGFVLLGFWLWGVITKSLLREFIFWLVAVSPFVIWLSIKYRYQIGIAIVWTHSKFRKSDEDDGNLTYDSRYKPQEQDENNDSIGEYIYKALQIMDTTHKWYDDEGEANRELVSVLKAQGLENVIYQYNLPNGRTVDIKVNDALIECKLSPSTSEVDRLIGQLNEYTKYSDEVHLTIFGQLDNYGRERIENEIDDRYENHVFLNYLDNPQRQRR